MEFKDQYKHPNWQKKRLEALEESEFTCQRCFDGESQLHVHHKRYVSGRKVWEYNNTELEVLCDSCHELAHGDKELFQKIQGRVCTEGLREITRVITGYLEVVCGPTGTGFNHAKSALNYEDPSCFDVMIGRLAAVASNSLSIHSIAALTEAIESLAPGEKVDCVISRRGGFFCEEVPF